MLLRDKEPVAAPRKRHRPPTEAAILSRGSGLVKFHAANIALARSDIIPALIALPPREFPVHVPAPEKRTGIVPQRLRTDRPNQTWKQSRPKPEPWAPLLSKRHAVENRDRISTKCLGIPLGRLVAAYIHRSTPRQHGGRDWPAAAIREVTARMEVRAEALIRPPLARSRDAALRQHQRPRHPSTNARARPRATASIERKDRDSSCELLDLNLKPGLNAVALGAGDLHHLLVVLVDDAVAGIHD